MDVDQARLERGGGVLVAQRQLDIAEDHRGDVVVLVGDAAGLAYRQSGEGIRPAVESGLLAAATIVAANGQYTRSRLEPYQERLQARLGSGSVSGALSRIVPAGLGAVVARRLLETRAFVREVVLDRWFLHRYEPALNPRGA